MTLDPTTRAVLETIKGCGFTVTAKRDDDGCSFQAVSVETDETFIVKGDDVYATACELAEKCGVDVMDG